MNIPKANGGERPLGIPTIKDRIVQMSCKMVIEPIFEADFEDTNYGFRPKRSASQAITKIKENLQAGLTEIYDADIKSYFDTIPHDKLMIVIAKRISDRNIKNVVKKSESRKRKDKRRKENKSWNTTRRRNISTACKYIFEFGRQNSEQSRRSI
ncbi:MAG: reverse transcriptase domain-containing protein [Ignavibacteriae bacterium]|nr:reverse transcriptase domain-containing protein [Ignavibacteriota bacterium]